MRSTGRPVWELSAAAKLQDLSLTYQLVDATSGDSLCQDEKPIPAFDGQTKLTLDVPDMQQVLPEAYEMVEDGFLTTEDFRDFTFANAVRLWGTNNPRFFEGTAVARQAAEVLAAQKQPVLLDAAK